MHSAERTLRELIKFGRGQGHGTAYQPWLQISRRKTPSNSNINFRHLPPLWRHGHFLSRNEVNIALWLLFLGADDLREQYPLWPFAHPHPLYGHPSTPHEPLSWSRGTLAIARDLGIDHGWFVGTRIPYVATTDFMLTVLVDGIPRAIAIAAKPSALVDGRVAVKMRVKERLALEMAYARELDISWFVTSDGDIPLPLRENLELILPGAVLEGPLDCLTLSEDFCGHLGDALRRGEPVGEARMRSIQNCRLDQASGLALFYNGLWTRRLPIDIRYPLVLSQPARLTDFSWAEEAANAILRGYDHG